MLVLSRAKGERILIGDDIEIVVVHMKWKKVAIGVKAPRDVPVVRAEIVDQREGDDDATNS